MASKQVNDLPHEPVVFNVKFAQLVGYDNSQLTVEDCSTSEDLKCEIELSSGIPADLLELYHNGNPVNDSSIFQANIGVTNIDVKLSPEWQHFIQTSTKSENYHVVRRRSRVKMQELTQEERIFVASFVAARHANSALLFGILPCNKNIEKTSNLSKRNILHAAVQGGDKNCIVNILMNGGGRLIDKEDINGETPLSMAKNMKDIADMLNVYSMMTKQSLQEEQSDAEPPGISDEENDESEEESSIEETTHDEECWFPNDQQDGSTHSLDHDLDEILECDATVINRKEELPRQEDNCKSPNYDRNDGNSTDSLEKTNDGSHTASQLDRRTATADLNVTQVKTTERFTDSSKSTVQSSRRRKMGLPSFPILSHASNYEEPSAVKKSTITGMTARDLLAPKPPTYPVPERRRMTHFKNLDIHDDRLNTRARQRSLSTSNTPKTRLLNRERERTRVCSEFNKEENTPKQITFQQWLVNKNEQTRKASLTIPKEKRERRLSLGSPVIVSTKPERKLSIPSATSASHGNTCERSGEAFQTWLLKKDEEALERDLKLLNKVICQSNERKKEDICAQLKRNKIISSKADKYWRF